MFRPAKEDDFIDYYALLQVPFEATKQEITKSYRQLALKMHPDKNPDDPQAGEKFATIVEAKEVLLESEKSREDYDKEYKEYHKKKKSNGRTKKNV